MEAAQDAELAARQFSQLVVHLETPLAGWRQRLHELVLRLQAAPNVRP
jgi:hypothetical protein